MYGQKKTFYKKTPFKKTSVDYEKKFKSLIKKTIVEKKEHKVVNKQFYQSGLNIVAFPSPTAAPTYSLAPDITQGAGQDGRLGNKISTIGHECIMHFCYKDTGSTVSPPYHFRILCMSVICTYQ